MRSEKVVKCQGTLLSPCQVRWGSCIATPNFVFF